MTLCQAAKGLKIGDSIRRSSWPDAHLSIEAVSGLDLDDRPHGVFMAVDGLPWCPSVESLNADDWQREAP